MTPPGDRTRIVAEISVTWIEGAASRGQVLAQRFEHVIAVNESRGYALESWQLGSALVPGDDDAAVPDQLVETIIAVFVKMREL